MRHLIYVFSIIFLLSLSSCARRVVVRPSAPNNVTIVRTLPNNHKIVTIKGKPYYTWNGRYYRKTRRGFVFAKI